ncbi:MAG: autotransporter outer membrane beta-barrel domain-containing protein [Alphaproteobacteria bacterium]
MIRRATASQGQRYARATIHEISMLTHCVLPGFEPSLRQAGARFPADQSTLLSRAMLLGSVAATALFIIAPQQSAQAGPAVCTLSGTTVTCTGDQSGGIVSGTDFTAPPVDTLIVEDLTGAIAPDPGDDGIYFEVPDGNNITVSSDTGGFGISTTGDDAQGIFGYVHGDGNVAITSTGNISTTGDNAEGIFGYVFNDGNVNITSTGKISATGTDSEGIYGRVDGIGDVTITSTGDVSTQKDHAEGIYGAIANNGDVTINSTGEISTAGDDSQGISGRVGADGNVTISNTGNISILVSSSEGIYGLIGGDGDLTITNTGDISTTGDFADGIYGRVGDNGNVVITSTGDISTKGNFTDGILGRVGGDGDVTITSMGNISTQGSFSYGINGKVIGNGDVSITNLGDISNIDGFAVGIYGHITGNGDVTIISSGDISTANGSSEGIYGDISGNGDLVISHKGNITAANSAGIQANVDGTGGISITHSGGSISGTTGIDVDNRISNAPATLNLFGTVTGTNGEAIDFQGDGHDVVNLHAGAVINGTIDFGNGNDGKGGTNPDDIDTLNAGLGFNGVVDFKDFESAPENINGKFVLTNGGIQAVFADISSGVAANAVLLDDLVGSILGGIDSQNADVFEAQGSASGDQALGYAPLKKTANMDRFDVFDAIKSSYRVWGTGFGALTGQKGTTSTLNSDIGFAGGMVGVETAVRADFVAGFFLGRSMSRIDVAFNSMDMETGSTFAGVYTRHNWDETWLNFTMLGGWAVHDDVRYVGVTRARADYNSFFVAPAVTLGTRLSGILPDHDVLPSLRVNYTGQFIEGYTETGVALPLSVNSRNVHLLSSRAQIAVPYNWTQSNGTALKIEGVVGVDGTLNLGDDSVQTTIAGSPLGFSTKFANASASGFVGASFNLLSADNRYAFNTSAEGHLDIDGSLALRGNVSVSGRF